MSGRIGSAGQLALMDAIVFFVAAIAASGIMISLVESNPVIEGDPCGACDVDDALSVILHSSLGEVVDVLVDGDQVILSRGDTMADCLMLEAHAIAEGDDAAGFGRLNLRLMDIAGAVFGTFMEPSFRLVDITDEIQTVLISIPFEWQEVRVAYAASAELSDAHGGEFIVQLRAAPVPSA